MEYSIETFKTHTFPKYFAFNLYTRRGNCIDGRIMRFHFAYQIASFSWPQLNISSSATGNNSVATRKEAEAAYPVFVGVIERFNNLVCSQIPLFDASVSGSAE